jgi:hypothetical protein
MTENTQSRPGTGRKWPEMPRRGPGTRRAADNTTSVSEPAEMPLRRPYNPRLLILHVDFFDLMLEQLETM